MIIYHSTQILFWITTLLQPLYKIKCPRNGSGDNSFLRDGFCFQRITGSVFKRNFGSFLLVFHRDVDLVLTDIGHFGWFNTGIRSGFSFGLWTLVFIGFLDLVFLSDVGLGFLWILDFGFSLGRWKL
jgi:hypothetical protein